MKYPIKMLVVPMLAAISVSAQSGETFEFSHEVKTNIKMYENDQQDGNYDYDFLYPDDGAIMGVRGTIEMQGQRMETQVVIDLEKESMVSLIEQAGMKMGIRMDVASLKEIDNSSDDGKARIVKTGRSKEIMGYNAEEYEVTDGESYALLWMTDDLDLANFYEAFASMSQKQQMMTGAIPDGFMLMMTAWPKGKEGDQKFVMEVTEINKNKNSTISTEGYRIMEMPNR